MQASHAIELGNLSLPRRMEADNVFPGEGKKAHTETRLFSGFSGTTAIKGRDGLFSGHKQYGNKR